MSYFDIVTGKLEKEADALGIEVSRIPEIVSMLREVAPDQWLDKALRKHARQTRLGAAVHPLTDRFSKLSLAGYQAVSELINVASYLRIPAAQDTAARHAMLHQLRSNYSHALLQLAWAFRLTKAGATDVLLEPLAANGRVGDVSFRWEGVDFFVECYNPEVVDKTSAEIHQLLTQARDALGNHDFPRHLEIRLYTQLTSALRKLIVAETRVLVRELAAVLTDGITPRAFARIHEAPGQVRLSLTLKDSRRVEGGAAGVWMPRAPDGLGHLNPRAAEYGARVRKGGPNEPPIMMGPSGSVEIYTEPSDTEAAANVRLLNRVVDSLEGKLAQARSDSDAIPRMAIVELKLNLKLKDGNDSRLAYMKQRLLSRRPDVAGICLVRPIWMLDERRWRYEAVPINGKRMRMPSRLLNALDGIERDMSWI
jgi:hypothetical protein